MIRINLSLFVIVILVAIALVSAQYKNRVLTGELEEQMATHAKLATEYGRLQLEQSTYAMHSKLEAHAKKELNMSVPDIKRMKTVQLD